MKLKTILSSFLLLGPCILMYGQLESYSYKRELLTVTDQWHRISLPDAMYANVKQDLSDIRIYGITAKNDTVEAPYLLHLNAPKKVNTELEFRRLNQSRNKKGYYFIFELTSMEIVNQISLHFNQQNFDWNIDLEGSQNLKDWYTIARDYRVLSIKNEHTDYTYSTLSFPDSQYRYFRILVQGKEKPRLNRAFIRKQKEIDAHFKTYTPTKFTVTEDKGTKQTLITLDFGMAVPLHELDFNINGQIDYYRPMRIALVTDSIETEKGWKRNYRSVFQGTLSSIKEERFSFETSIARYFRIYIDNNDNIPLSITNVTAKGYPYELSVRFPLAATYYLAYGNKTIGRPRYDLQETRATIPEQLSFLEVGEEQEIPKKEAGTKAGLFTNTLWLWGIMGLIIVLLGGFTLKMLRKN